MCVYVFQDKKDGVRRSGEFRQTSPLILLVRPFFREPHEITMENGEGLYFGMERKELKQDRLLPVARGEIGSFSGVFHGGGDGLRHYELF